MLFAELDGETHAAGVYPGVRKVGMNFRAEARECGCYRGNVDFQNLYALSGTRLRKCGWSDFVGIEMFQSNVHYFWRFLR